MLYKINSADLPILNFPNLVPKDLRNIKKLFETINLNTDYNNAIIQSIIAILYQQYNTNFFMTITIPAISTFTELIMLPIFQSLIGICDEIEVLSDKTHFCGLNVKGLKPIVVDHYLKLKKENKLDFCIIDLLKPYNELPDVNSNEIKIYEYKKNNTMIETENGPICSLNNLLGNKFFQYLASECIKNGNSFAIPLIGLTIEEIETSVYFDQMTYLWDRVCLLGSGDNWISTHLFISGLKNEIELILSK